MSGVDYVQSVGDLGLFIVVAVVLLIFLAPLIERLRRW